MFKKKIEVIALGDFMRGEMKLDRKPPTYSLVPLVLTPLIPTTVSAEAAQNVQSKMTKAFLPLIELIQGMAYPIGLAVVLGGAITVMLGNSDKGFSMMQKAGMGYVLCMMLPMVFEILSDVMQGVA